MDKNLKDYLYMYIGCKVISLDGGSMTYILCGIDYDVKPLFRDEHGHKIHLDNWKMVLHKFSDMTDEDKEYIYPLQSGSEDFSFLESIIMSAKMTKNLLSKHYDLYGLIESGNAIDYKTIKQ